MLLLLHWNGARVCDKGHWALQVGWDLDVLLGQNQRSHIRHVLSAFHLLELELSLFERLHLMVLGSHVGGSAAIGGLENVPEDMPPLVQKALGRLHAHGQVGNIVVLQKLVDRHRRRLRCTRHIFFAAREKGRSPGQQVAQVVRHGGHVGLGHETLGRLRQRVLDQELVDVGVQQLLGRRRQRIAHATRRVEHGPRGLAECGAVHLAGGV